MNARTADFAATTPWAGVQSKPTDFPPSPHARTHGPGGIDPVSLAISQIIGLAEALASLAPLTVTINGYPLSSSPIVLRAGDIPGVIDSDSAQTLYNKTIIGAIIRQSLELGFLSDGSSGENAFQVAFENHEDLTADRVLTIELADADRTIALRANLVISAGGVPDTTLTISTNGADRLVELETDFSVLSDGSGGGPLTIRSRTGPRTIDLSGSLVIAGGFDLAISLAQNTGIVLAGNFTTAGGTSDLVCTLTGDTNVTFPTSGTLETVVGAAAQIAAALVPYLLTAVAVAVFQPLTGNSFAVAGLPSAAANVGRVVYCTNGASGSPCAAISDGTNWKQIALGATVTP